MTTTTTRLSPAMTRGLAALRKHRRLDFDERQPITEATARALVRRGLARWDEAERMTLEIVVSS